MAKPNKFEIIAQGPIEVVEESLLDAPLATEMVPGKPLTLQQRITEIEINALAIASEDASGRQSLKSIQFYPPQIAELRRQALVLSELSATILDPFNVQLMAIKLQIADNKADFPNENARKAEYERCQANLAGYAAAQIEQKAIECAVKRINIEIEFLEDQFRVAKLLTELRLTKAANGTDSQSESNNKEVAPL